MYYGAYAIPYKQELNTTNAFYMSLKRSERKDNKTVGLTHKVRANRCVAVFNQVKIDTQLCVSAIQKFKE